ncbi:Calcium uniporter protein [Spatholobus suberectus]|nr:Calcium uniporter protein [Spatholobus suberectus]
MGNKAQPAGEKKSWQLLQPSQAANHNLRATATLKEDLAQGPRDNGLFRSPQLAGNLLNMLRAMDIAWKGMGGGKEEGGTVKDACRLLKVKQVEIAKLKLRETRKGCVMFSKFIRIYAKNCLNQDQSMGLSGVCFLGSKA